MNKFEELMALRNSGGKGTTKNVINYVKSGVLPGTSATTVPTSTTAASTAASGAAASNPYSAVPNFGSYKPSDAVTNTLKAMQAAQAAKPGAYQSQWGTQLNDIMSQIMSRPDFKYDLNGDAMYQQYKDQYTRQGKLAMQNAIGQAAAMTGGYGNSYAQQVGQQQFQGYMQQLNDRIPELYNMAMQAYQMKGDQLNNQYNMIANRENQDYGRYQDSVANWRNDLSYVTDRYDTERNLDYNTFNNERDFQQKQWANRQGAAQAEVEYLLNAGREVPDSLLAEAGVGKDYYNARRAAILAQQQAAAAAAAAPVYRAVSSSSGDGKSKGLTTNWVSEASNIASSGIKKKDSEGNTTATNSELVAQAIKNAVTDGLIDQKDVVNYNWLRAKG